MDTGLRDTFSGLWDRYFPGAELPITFELGGTADGVERAPAPKRWRCFVCDLAKVRRGTSLVFGEDSIGCRGGRFYLGYDTERFADFRYFLSCGKPGMEGERYKQTPEIVDALVKEDEHIPSAGKDYVFRRWDRLTEADDPDAVVFFAHGEVLWASSRSRTSTGPIPAASSALSAPGAAPSSTTRGSSSRRSSRRRCSGCSTPPHGPASRRTCSRWPCP